MLSGPIPLSGGDFTWVPVLLVAAFAVQVAIATLVLYAVWQDRRGAVVGGVCALAGVVVQVPMRSDAAIVVVPVGAFLAGFVLAARPSDRRTPRQGGFVRGLLPLAVWTTVLATGALVLITVRTAWAAAGTDPPIGVATMVRWVLLLAAAQFGLAWFVRRRLRAGRPATEAIGQPDGAAGRAER